MDGQTIVGSVAAVIALAAMGVTIWQAVIARQQSRYAKDQVDEAKRANALTEQAIEEDRKAREEERRGRELRLDISAKPERFDIGLLLVVRVENNSEKTAIVQDVALVFGDGSHLTDGGWGGDFAMTNWQDEKARNWLPRLLEPGQFFTFSFQERRTPSSSPSAPDYGNVRWRKIDRIEVKASNKVFKLTGEESNQQPPHWKNQFQSYLTNQ